MINTKRIHKLIEGTQEPETDLDLLVIGSYTHGFTGGLLAPLIIELSPEWEQLDITSKEHVIIGYAMGQMKLNEIEDEMETWTEKKKFH